MSFINVLKKKLGKCEIWKKICALFEQRQKTVLPQGVGKTAPYLEQDGPSPFLLPLVFPGLIIAVYFLPYNVEQHICCNAIVEGRGYT